MPLNKLENFIKNTEGRILYVNPNDLDATDSIDNQGNSLTKPFKSVQRALLESARFSYLRGDNNDITEKTTILLFPGEHIIDNRPGFGVRESDLIAKAVSPAGVESFASNEFTLTLDSNFDLTQANNQLYKFNSIYGGVIVPRGTSIVGLDLRKTKIRPKYVPNPTDPNVKQSAIFRITGACYFWQFSIFDANELTTVYTDPVDFSENNKSKPTFSHHKVTCFEYADGVTIPSQFEITDLDMYYAKLSNAYNNASGRNIDQKFPTESGGFAKQRPEWEIVGAFATDPLQITSIFSGDGSTPGQIVTVSTEKAHNFTTNTPIKIKGVNVRDYNISTKVQTVLDEKTFTYLLPFVRDTLPAGSAAGLSASGSTVTIETDTVSGASPYVFNISLRSVWGMQGMHADGSKASGFRSMVVAQFTAISIQKDDRAFVKYNPQSRVYEGIIVDKVTGSALSSGSSSTNLSTVYHLDPDAIYRKGWQTTHIKISNDSFIQIVSVFAIGFRAHFESLSGADGSITNSNSNFGQCSLSCDGFKREAFDKDNKAYITSIITPRAINNEESNIDWISLDVGLTTAVGITSHLYLFGFKNKDDIPPVITQGYRIGSKKFDKLFLDYDDGLGNIQTYSSDILMVDRVTNDVSYGSDSSEKKHIALPPNSNFVFEIGVNNIKLGEKIILISEIGDLPENVIPNYVYYAITSAANSTRTDGVALTTNQIQLATSKSNAEAATPIALKVYGGQQLKVLSRVSEKNAGEIGSPIQWDATNSNWYIHANSGNQIYNALNTLGVYNLSERSDVTYLKRIEDDRSLDEKIFKVRVVIPKELINARNPSEGFIIQESSNTGVRNNSDFTLTNITGEDYLYNRNPRFISTCSYNNVLKIVTIRTDLPHNLKVGDQITIKNVTSTTNTGALENKGFNGAYLVSTIVDDKTFIHSTTDIFGTVHNPGVFTNNVNIRNASLPRFERNKTQGNFLIYRSEVINPYIYGVQDGVYHVYMINAANQVETEFTTDFYTQNIADLYPQLDKDNLDDNPLSTKSYAKRSPLGEVITNDLKRSITRETIDKFYTNFGICPIVTSISVSPTSVTVTLDREHGLGGVVTGTLNGGSGHTPGTYYNVKLFNEISLNTWDGATAKVIVGPSGNVTSAEIISAGSAYDSGETLYFDSSIIGGTPSASLSISSVGISTAIGNNVEFTGISTVSDKYHRITALPSKNQITIAKASVDEAPVVGQYVINNGPSISIISTSYSSVTGITTFNCGGYHGLSVGNRVRIIDSSNANLGDYLVLDRPSSSIFTIRSNTALSNPRFVLKHAISSNNAISDKSVENLGVRSLPILENEYLELLSDITSESAFPVRLINSGIGTTKRFPVGSYIQIDNEIMRITGSTLTGPSNNQITVIRGSMGTIKENHSLGSMIRKIKPVAIEFRRPSILRASGHTFEYLGYGPGNYSTALPQVQVKTLSEIEDFLAQSQETSGGSVIYTGMNSDGDFYIGNTKYSATSGEQTTFDIPIPTVTGQDPSRLSVVFDEVIIKERLLVEGGNSGTILSQFDGPVTFNENVTINKDLKLNGRVILLNKTESTTTRSGALVVYGGVGIGKNVNIGGNVTIAGNVSITGETSGSLFKASIGYIPTTNLGAYLGTSTNRFSEAYIGNIRIAHSTNDGTIETTSDNLILDSANEIEIKKTTSLIGNLTLSGPNVVPGPNSGTLTAAYLDVPNVTPIGSVVLWAGRSDNLPSNPGITMWGICNGQALNTYTYRTLHAIISNTYGGTAYQAGVTDLPSATTIFNLPNMSDRFIIGSTGNGGTNVTGSSTRTGGTKDSNVITHNHPLTGDGSHPHGVTIVTEGPFTLTGTAALSGDLALAGSAAPSGNLSLTSSLGDSGNLSMSGSASGGAHGHSGSTAADNAPHGHGLTINADGAHSHSYQRSNENNTPKQPGGGPEPNRGVFGSNTGNAGNHTHGGSVNSGNAPHTHGINLGGGGHSHTISTSGANHGHPISVTGGNHLHTVTVTGGSHSHPVTVTGAQHNHNGSVVTGSGAHPHVVESVGVSGNNLNLPPYFALFYIMRIV